MMDMTPRDMGPSKQDMLMYQWESTYISMTWICALIYIHVPMRISDIQMRTSDIQTRTACYNENSACHERYTCKAMNKLTIKISIHLKRNSKY